MSEVRLWSTSALNAGQEFRLQWAGESITWTGRRESFWSELWQRLEDMRGQSGRAKGEGGGGGEGGRKRARERGDG